MSPILVTMILSALFASSSAAQQQDNGTLRVATILSQPFVYQHPNGTLSGFIIDLLDTIAPIADFDYTIVPEPNRTYGILRHGRWQGIIGGLVNQEYDLGAADITITEARQQVVDFTTPFMQSQLRVLFNPADSTFQYLAIKGGATEQFLRNSTDPKVQQIWANIAENDGFVTSKEEAIRKVTQGGYGFVSEAAATASQLPENSSLKYAPEVYTTAQFALAVPQGSTWGPKLSEAILAVKTNGKLQELLEKHRLTEQQ